MQMPFESGKISKRKLVAALVLFVTYLAAVRFASVLYTEGKSSPAIIFPAAGIALAGLFLEGYGMWVVVALASLANSFIAGSIPATAVSVAVGSVVQALAGTYFLKRLNFDPRIWRLRDMALLMAVAGTVTVVSPTIGLIPAWLGGTAAAGVLVQRWFAWWLGGILSVMLLTPLIVSWISHPHVSVDKKYLAEALGAFSFLAAIDWVIFWTSHGSLAGVPLVYVMLVPLFWIALRFGNREIIAALLVTTALGLSGLAWGSVPVPPEMLGMRMLQMELFSVIIGLIFFIVSAISEERRVATARFKGYVAQLEEALEKIRSADRAKTEFIAVLAHELRNPLAPALTSLEFLELQAFSTPEKEAAALQAKRNIQNMGRLLDDLLDVSRVGQGKIKLQKEPVNIAVIIKRAMEDTRPLMGERRHELTLDIAEGLPPVMADPLRLEQVITNILNNAAKYTEPGGRISLRAGAEGERMVITVKDTGMGIPPELLPSIFEMFNQANRSASRASQGLGIGLGLVKKLMELHGGTVTAQSEGLGKGSEFTIALPLGVKLADASASPTAVSPAERSRPEEPGSGKKRILVVDDNEAAANALAKLFNRLGHDAHVAYAAREGMQKALELQPQLILLDIGLPEISGYEVAKTLRGHEGFKDTVFAAVSGYGQEEDRLRSREAGFDHHLVKPVGLDTWRDLLDEI